MIERGRDDRSDVGGRPTPGGRDADDMLAPPQILRPPMIFSAATLEGVYVRGPGSRSWRNAFLRCLGFDVVPETVSIDRNGYPTTNTKITFFPDDRSS